MNETIIKIHQAVIHMIEFFVQWPKENSISLEEPEKGLLFLDKVEEMAVDWYRACEIALDAFSHWMFFILPGDAADGKSYSPYKAECTQLYQEWNLWIIRVKKLSEIAVKANKIWKRAIERAEEQLSTGHMSLRSLNIDTYTQIPTNVKISAQMHPRVSIHFGKQDASLQKISSQKHFTIEDREALNAVNDLVITAHELLEYSTKKQVRVAHSKGKYYSIDIDEMTYYYNLQTVSYPIDLSCILYRWTRIRSYFRVESSFQPQNQIQSSILNIDQSILNALHFMGKWPKKASISLKTGKELLEALDEARLIALESFQAMGFAQDSIYQMQKQINSNSLIPFNAQNKLQENMTRFYQGWCRWRAEIEVLVTLAIEAQSKWQQCMKIIETTSSLISDQPTKVPSISCPRDRMQILSHVGDDSSERVLPNASKLTTEEYNNALKIVHALHDKATELLRYDQEMVEIVYEDFKGNSSSNYIPIYHNLHHAETLSDWICIVASLTYELNHHELGTQIIDKVKEQ